MKMEDQQRTSPVDGSVTWKGHYASPHDIAVAMERANQAFALWRRASQECRTGVCHQFSKRLRHHAEAIARAISMETGKPFWESKSEVQSAASKVDYTIESMQSRRSIWSDGNTESASVIRYRPIGSIAVLGPFNLPLHLPGAHIVPAVLMGNVVLFKPSEKSPAVGDWIQKCWEEAGLPQGVLQTLHGAARVAQTIVDSPALDGVCFTGSYRVGTEIHRMLAGRPECLLALEMGGNNPLIIESVQDPNAALHVLLASCFLTSGQRCTCARRLVVIDSDSNRRLIHRFLTSLPHLRVGLPFDTPAPFMGTLVSPEACQALFDAERRLESSGAVPLLRCQRLESSSSLVTPGVWEHHPGNAMEDSEVFGPLVTIEYVRDFDEALESANRTRYGLSAGLLSDSVEVFEKFVSSVRGGILNWNCPTTGATGRLPFGGLGSSGNHRPSGFFGVDYCSDPIASVQSPVLRMPKTTPPGLELIFAEIERGL